MRPATALALASLLALGACGGDDEEAPTTPITGKLRAPTGSTVVLQNNAADDLSLSVAAAASPRYAALDFRFATALADGRPFDVTVRTPPIGQSCSVYQGGSGTTPQATPLRVGCEVISDLLNRSSDDAVLGSYFDGGTSTEPIGIGGANVAIGSTATAFGEGRYAVFVSDAAGLDGSLGRSRQVFWRDRQTGETVLVSARADGIEGNAGSFAPALSADGQTVVFESYASNLAASDNNGVRDVFVWSAQDRVAGAVRVSVAAGGAEGNGESSAPTVSGDGTWVAFATAATNLAAGDYSVGGDNVVLQNRQTGQRILVSQGTEGRAAGFSGKPALSEDGARVAFYSFASNLVGGDGNGLWDIFVFDRNLVSMQRVSVPAAGGERDQGTESSSRVVAPAISGNGRFVAFATTSNTIVPGPSNGAQHVYVADTSNGSVVRASATAAGAAGTGDSPVGQGERPSLSFDGSWIAFTTVAGNLGGSSTGVVMRSLVTGETRLASPPAATNVATSPALSRTAAYVAFGAAGELDTRFAATGLFARFTGLQRAWFWTPH